MLLRTLYQRQDTVLLQVLIEEATALLSPCRQRTVGVGTARVVDGYHAGGHIALIEVFAVEDPLLADLALHMQPFQQIIKGGRAEAVVLCDLGNGDGTVVGHDDAEVGGTLLQHLYLLVLLAVLYHQPVVVGLQFLFLCAQTLGFLLGLQGHLEYLEARHVAGIGGKVIDTVC